MAAWEHGWKLDPIGWWTGSGSTSSGPRRFDRDRPPAATGARIVGQLANGMARRGVRRGLVSGCGAGAPAGAVVLERD